MESFFEAEENTKIPVRLVNPNNPNKEKILELEVTESNERFAIIYMQKLIAYAKTIGEICKTTKIKRNRVAIEFESEEIAAEIRKQWEERL